MKKPMTLLVTYEDQCKLPEAEIAIRNEDKLREQRIFFPEITFHNPNSKPKDDSAEDKADDESSCEDPTDEKVGVCSRECAQVLE